MSPSPVVVVPYDPTWPADFEVLRNVLASALGDVARAIHHMGSTAVPGIPSGGGPGHRGPRGVRAGWAERSARRTRTELAGAPPLCLRLGPAELRRQKSGLIAAMLADAVRAHPTG